jgi:predicted amidophosphoribosyltransferase
VPWRAIPQSCATLIQSFKYGDRHEGLPLFGRWLAAAGAELLADADLIVPVPLYRSRLWSRRFNQSALLARAVGRLTGVPVDCFLLGRVRRTPSQVGLTAEQRRRNVAGAFRVMGARGQASRKRIVVVDDVITHRRHSGCLRADPETGWRGTGRCLGAARAVEPAAFLL